MMCDASGTPVCDTAYLASTEVCNGIDDDCDGVIDDNTLLTDDDGDGIAEIDGDCDDSNSAVHPDATESGAYWSDCNVAKSSRHGRDPELAARLWTETERIVASL